MKVTKVVQFGNVPQGTELWLTDDQARARAHLITRLDTKKTLKDRKLYAADGQLGFKAGEELAIEGNLDRGLEIMFGIEADAAEPKADPKAKKLLKAEDDVATARAAHKVAFDSHAAETDPHKKAEAAKVVETAQAALDEAETALVAVKG